MVCVAKSVLRLATVVLLCGTATLALAQSIEEELRLETDTFDESVLPPPPPPAQARITIGDDTEVPVRRRRSTIDPYAPVGIPAGAFRLYPSLEIGSVVTSNVRRVATAAKADAALRLRPSLRIESNWVRHSLTSTASFEAEQFVSDKDIKTLSGSVQSALRLDVRHTTRADLDLSYSATSTELGSSQLPATATGARLDHVVASNAAVTHDFGGVEGRLRLGVSRNTFGEVDLTGGGTEDNTDRNYTQLTLAARAALRTDGILQPFAELAYEPRLHDKSSDRHGIKRNSQGVRLTAGVSIADDPVWSGDVAASLELRDYSDDSLATAIAPGMVANLTWRPTDLTRFEFNAGANLSETVAVGVSATKNWTVGTTVTHSLRENIDISAGLRSAFEYAAGETNITTTGTLGLNWTLHPNLVLGTSYELTAFNSATAGGDYTDHRLLTSIILRR
jgi:hypothetical protein